MARKSSYIQWKAKTHFEVIRFLADRTHLDDPLDHDQDDTEFINFRGHGRTFQWLLRETASTYQQRSPEDCARFAIKLYGVAMQPDMGSLVRTLLEGRNIDTVLCSVADDTNKTLLHCAAWNLGEVCARAEDYEDLTNYMAKGGNFARLLDLIRDLVKGGSDLHGLTHRGRYPTTPFLEILTGYSFWSGFDWWHVDQVAVGKSDELFPITTWLEQLKRSGVDLIDYGRREKRIHSRVKISKEFDFYEEKVKDDGKASSVRLTGFEFGPEPEDWEFYFTKVMDNSFVQFWDMIGHPERALPEGLD